VDRAWAISALAALDEAGTNGFRPEGWKRVATKTNNHWIIWLTPKADSLAPETRKGALPMFPMKKPMRLLGMVFQID
jgi:hypothetical protein